MRAWIQSAKSLYHDIEHLLSGGNESCYHTIPVLEKDQRTISRHLFETTQSSFQAGVLLSREGRQLWKLDRHFGFAQMNKKMFTLPEMRNKQVKKANATPVLKHWGLQTKCKGELTALIFAPNEDTRFVLFTSAPNVMLYDKTEKLLDYLSEALAA